MRRYCILCGLPKRLGVGATEGDGIGKAAPVAACVFAIIAMIASPASAQQIPEEEPVPLPEGSYVRDEYVVTKDGTLTIGGDVSVRCEDLLEFGVPSGASSAGQASLEQSVSEQVRVCRAAGFPPEGAASASTPAPASAPGTGGGRSLPETGGPVLPALSLVGGMSAAVGALLVLCVRR